MVESLNREDFKTAIEVGVRTGWFSKYILDHTQMQVWAIDPWETNPELAKNATMCYYECQDRLGRYGNRAQMIKGYSPQEAVNFKDKAVDFIYIDGLHDYESVKKDVEAWWPKIRDGGVLSGHDYNPVKWPGVVKAVNEFCQAKEVDFTLTGVVGNALTSNNGGLDEYDGDEQSWYIIK